MSHSQLLYLQIADHIEYQIRNEVLKVGDKLPSLRTVAYERGVSMSTAQQSYFELESRGLVESRPQSGYYVSYSHKQFRSIPRATQPVVADPGAETEDLMAIITQNRGKARFELSEGVPSVALLPVAKLNKAIVNATRNLEGGGLNYDK